MDKEDGVPSHNIIQPSSSVKLLSRVRLYDPVDSSTPSLSVHHQLLEFTQTHVHWVGDVIQPSHLLSSAGSHHGKSHPWQSSCGEDLTGKGGSGLEGFPGPAQASTPKPKSVYCLLCFSPTLLTLVGGYPRPSFSEQNQFRALINKSPGLERSISILTLC